MRADVILVTKRVADSINEGKLRDVYRPSFVVVPRLQQLLLITNHLGQSRCLPTVPIATFSA